MNKLLTFEGGQPFTTQDIAFLQDNFYSAITNLIDSLCSGIDCILTGIISGDSRDSNSKISAIPGSVFIKGNIYVLTKDIPKSSEKSYYLCIRQLEQEKRQFRDSSEHNVYLVDDAYMSDSPSDISLDLRYAFLLEDVLVRGEGKYNSVEATFPDGVTGDVYSITKASIYTNKTLSVTINKTKDSNDNVLCNFTGVGYKNYVGIAIYDDKVFTVRSGGQTLQVFTYDGTPYNGRISLTNVKLGQYGYN